MSLRLHCGARCLSLVSRPSLSHHLGGPHARLGQSICSIIMNIFICSHTGKPLGAAAEPPSLVGGTSRLIQPAVPTPAGAGLVQPVAKPVAKSTKDNEAENPFTKSILDEVRHRGIVSFSSIICNFYCHKIVHTHKYIQAVALYGKNGCQLLCLKMIPIVIGPIYQGWIQ